MSESMRATSRARVSNTRNSTVLRSPVVSAVQYGSSLPPVLTKQSFPGWIMGSRNNPIAAVCPGSDVFRSVSGYSAIQCAKDVRSFGYRVNFT